jgi:hypothetical protein
VSQKESPRDTRRNTQKEQDIQRETQKEPSSGKGFIGRGTRREERELRRETHKGERRENEKYDKYKNLAKRKPIVLSDSSTEESSSSDDFPSPSPVRRDEYSNIVRKMRELERQLKKR